MSNPTKPSPTAASSNSSKSAPTFALRSGLRAAFILLLAAPLLAQPQNIALEQPSAPGIVSAKLLLGLPEIAPNSAGLLSFDSANLRFAVGPVDVLIPRQRILSISSGDERIETGGTTGRVARMVIPYGGGLALGAVTHKKVLDPTGQYHGAVFVLSPEDTASTVEALDRRLPTVYAPPPAPPAVCTVAHLEENAVRVELIGADLQSAFPPEDRVLLYEHLIDQLKSEKTPLTVYRAGDRSPAAQCAEFTLKVQAVAFNKGDQAVRASVGPLGHFVGTTKLKYRLTVTTQSGTLLLDDDMKKSQGSDSDSLNVTKGISKAVVKSLEKSRKQLRRTQSA